MGFIRLSRGCLHVWRTARIPSQRKANICDLSTTRKSWFRAADRGLKALLDCPRAMHRTLLDMGSADWHVPVKSLHLTLYCILVSTASLYCHLTSYHPTHLTSSAVWIRGGVGIRFCLVSFVFVFLVLSVIMEWFGEIYS